MRKKIVTLFLVAAMMFSVSGCGDRIKVTEDLDSGTRVDVSGENDGSGNDSNVDSTDNNSDNKPDDNTDNDSSSASGGDATEASTETTTEAATDSSGSSGSGGMLNADVLAAGPVLYARHFMEYFRMEDSYKYYYTHEYDEVLLAKDSESAYPGIKKALDDFNSVMTAEDEGWSTEEKIEAAKEQYEASEGSYFSEYYDKSSATVFRLDDKVLSIKVFGENYYGGVHGNYGTGGYNYYVDTGEKISLLDVVSSLDDLETAACEIYSRDYAELIESEYGSMESLQGTFDSEEGLSWTLGPECLQLYYSPYYIASYAAGEITLNIRYEDFPDLFNKGIGTMDGDWAICYGSMLLDIDGDGAQDFVSVNQNYEYDEENDYSYLSGYEICAGSDSQVFDNYCYQMDTYIAKKGGRFFIYVQTKGDNDWYDIDEFEITGGKIKEIGHISGRFAGTDEDGDYGDGWYTSSDGLFYNPNVFFISSRMDLLSTYDGSRPSRLNDNGEIEPIDKAYVTYNGFEVTSEVDLTLDIVDEAGNVTGQETITSGSKYIFYKTDNETYVDCKLEDGRIARVIVDISDWPHTVDGKDIYDVFDGLIFAG